MIKKFIIGLITVPHITWAANTINHELINRNKILEILIFLIITLIVMIGIAYLTKQFRFGPKFTCSDLQITHSVPLSTKDKLIIVKSKNEKILLGLSPGRIAYLCHLNDTDYRTHSEI